MWNLKYDTNGYDDQDSRGIEGGVHKYSKNTSRSGMIYTEHLLNTSRRPQTSESAIKPVHNK